MKKILTFSTPLLAILLVLTGCSSTGQNTSNNIGATANTVKSGNVRRPDFGQPDRPADLRGVVTSIVGNEVTVLKIALNGGRRASSTPENATNNSTTSNTPSFSLGGAGAVRGGTDGGPSGFVRGTGGGGAGRPGGPGSFGAGGTTDRATMIANLKAMSTGQEKIIIPVGIRMLKVDTSNNTRTMVEATLADITADKSITVWTNAAVADTATNATASTTTSVTAERKIAEFVLIN
ncbi:MAG: hypothetical protein WC249_01250 [Patescibacteria group bacterium]|jgi:hypothetical protein